MIFFHEISELRKYNLVKECLKNKQCFVECPDINMTTALIVDKYILIDENISYLTGTVLKLSCEKSHFLNNPDLSKVECEEGGMWNSSFPTCLAGLILVVFFLKL